MIMRPAPGARVGGAGQRVAGKRGQWAKGWMLPRQWVIFGAGASGRIR